MKSLGSCQDTFPSRPRMGLEQASETCKFLMPGSGVGGAKLRVKNGHQTDLGTSLDHWTFNTDSFSRSVEGPPFTKIQLVANISTWEMGLYF